MDKQQAADNHSCIPFIEGISNRASFLAGWEAREAQQSPTDAVAFADWILKESYESVAGEKWSGLKGNSSRRTSAELYKLFNPSGAAPKVAGFDLSKDDLEKLLSECLKREEIGGDAAVQLDRVKELIHWFRRFVDGSANPKWFRSHAFELVYFIATTAGNRFIDLEAVKKSGWLEGIAITPAERSLAERMNLIPATAPQAAGPVWVKATTEMPIGKIEREKLSIKYKGSPDVLIFLNGEWHWWDDLHDKHNPMIEKTYFVHAASWSTIEWLKESESGQQVFTREDMERAYRSAFSYSKDMSLESNLLQFMNTNYPNK